MTRWLTSSLRARPLPSPCSSHSPSLGPWSGIPTDCGCTDAVCLVCVRDDARAKIQSRSAPTCLQIKCCGALPNASRRPLPPSFVSALFKDECPLCAKRPAPTDDGCAPMMSLGCGHGKHARAGATPFSTPPHAAHPLHFPPPSPCRPPLFAACCCRRRPARARGLCSWPPTPDHRFCSECAGKHILAELEAKQLPSCPRHAECKKRLDERGDEGAVRAALSSLTGTHALATAERLESLVLDWYDLRQQAAQEHPLLKPCRAADCKGDAPRSLSTGCVQIEPARPRLPRHPSPTILPHQMSAPAYPPPCLTPSLARWALADGRCGGAFARGVPRGLPRRGRVLCTGVPPAVLLPVHGVSAPRGLVCQGGVAL